MNYIPASLAIFKNSKKKSHQHIQSGSLLGSHSHRPGAKNNLNLGIKSRD